jgi:uncharacterized protein YegP (UPF0339 family)
VKKLFAALALVGLFAAGTTLAVAQREKPADPVKPADPKKPADPVKVDPKAVKGSVVLKPDAKGRYRISVKGEDGKTLLMSAGNGFETEKDARAAVEEIKGILAGAKVTVEKADEKDKEK